MKKEKRKKLAKISEKIRSNFFDLPIGNTFTGTQDVSCQKDNPKNSESSIPYEMSMDERNLFMKQKMDQSENSIQQNSQHETLKQGIINALSRQLLTTSKLKNQQQDLKKQCKANQKTSLELSVDLKQEKEKTEELEKELKRCKKDIKKICKDTKEIKQIIALQSAYAKVCNKNTPFDELYSEWKHACKHSPKMK